MDIFAPQRQAQAAGPAEPDGHFLHGYRMQRHSRFIEKIVRHDVLFADAEVSGGEAQHAGGSVAVFKFHAAFRAASEVHKPNRADGQGLSEDVLQASG